MSQGTVDTQSVVETYREIERSLTSPGAPFEMTSTIVRGELIRTYRHAESSLYDVFAALGRDHGDNLLVTDGETTHTYAEVFADADRLAAALVRDYGITTGDHVGIVMSNQYAYLVTLFAILRAGGVAVLYNARSSTTELTAAMADVPSTVTVVDPRRVDLVRTADPRTRVIATQTDVDDAADLRKIIARDHQDLPSPPADPDSTALILFTSGTSGAAKGVELTHRNMCNVVLNMRFVADTNIAFAANTYGLSVDEVRGFMPQISALLIFPLFHVSGLAALSSAMGSGGFIVTMDRWDPDRAADLIERHGITLMSGPPMVVSDLMAIGGAEDKLRTLVNVVPGGQATPPNITAQISARLPHSRRSSGWGMTEVGGSVCTAGGDILGAFPDTAGPMSPTMDVRVIDADGRELPAGGVGELYLRGGLIMKGYFGRPADTDAAFDGSWLRTGDIGYVDEHGLVYLVDRKKDLVITRGENISCVEVESVLAASDRFTEVAVFGVPDPRLGERLIAAVCPRAEYAGISSDEVKAIVGATLSSLKIPDEVVFNTEPLPRNATGKLLKRVLRQSFLDHNPPGQ
ncbi:class I adenylate-forming enzyme family protein [Williamsia sp. 1135]|uniref:class I adenylate-forming enzyme family protein n=1 Tax=Williamsia sp. 1135 TaxID=1889262 RepID=UPI001F0AEA26|nr:class I adenylate-forming enzyme family protein [Williamsia sp. 1135]